MTTKRKPKHLSRRKYASRVKVRDGLRKGSVIMRVTVRHRGGFVAECAAEYVATSGWQKRRVFHGLVHRIGPARARRLMAMGEGVERVVAYNRHRTPEQRRREYRDDEFVEL